MTRTARRGPDNKKKHEASDWHTLKTDNQNLASKKKVKVGSQIFLAELAQILDTAAARISGERPLLS